MGNDVNREFKYSPHTRVPSSRPVHNHTSLPHDLPLTTFPEIAIKLSLYCFYSSTMLASSKLEFEYPFSAKPCLFCVIPPNLLEYRTCLVSSLAKGYERADYRKGRQRAKMDMSVGVIMIIGRKGKNGPTQDTWGQGLHVYDNKEILCELN